MTDRGVSVTVNYVLGLAVATLLITGLLYAAGNVVGDRKESATRAELRVIGERTTADLLTADRLAQTGASDVVVSVSAPGQFAGDQYSLTLNASEREVVLETFDPAVEVRVPFQNTTSVRTSTVTGGDVRIVLVDSGGPNPALEVRSS